MVERGGVVDLSKSLIIACLRRESQNSKTHWKLTQTTMCPQLFFSSTYHLFTQTEFTQMLYNCALLRGGDVA